MGVVRDFLSHWGFSMLAKETSGADVIFYNAESAATILTRVAIDAGSIDDEKAIPELDRKDIAEIHAMCLAYAAARPDVSCVRSDVLSLTLMAERQGRILHLIGAYMWEKWLHGTRQTRSHVSTAGISNASPLYLCSICAVQRHFMAADQALPQPLPTLARTSKETLNKSGRRMGWSRAPGVRSRHARRRPRTRLDEEHGQM